MAHEKIMQLNPLIHAPTRLAVLSILMSAENANFNFLKEATGTTDGNLSSHLSKLEANGMILIEKTFKGKRPQTICSIREKGREAFLAYLNQLEQILEAQRDHHLVAE